MIEIIIVIVLTTRVAALARARGRSTLWAIGLPICWLLGDLFGLYVADGDPLFATFAGPPVAAALSLSYYGAVGWLPSIGKPAPVSRGDNFACPACGSLQTEDRSGHQWCNACGAGFRREG